MDTASAAAPRTTPWSGNRMGRRLVVALSYPLFLLLNRPGLQWFARAAYDFALRCNGVAINFPGAHGLTVGEERFLRKLLNGETGGVLFDVGANNGAYTRFMRLVSSSAQIYAFEPHPRTFAALRDRTVADAKLVLVNKAVSDTEGAIKLYDFAAQDGSTQASLDEDAVRLFTADTVAHDVLATTIDGFMAEQGLREIRFLKIDTEGFDIAVLRGARSALAARAIGAIQFEFIPANIARHVTMRDFFEVLDGYTIHRLCMNGALAPLVPYDVKRCEIYVTHNLVALPNR
jgi:FkbM family methyltransferase